MPLLRTASASSRLKGAQSMSMARARIRPQGAGLGRAVGNPMSRGWGFDQNSLELISRSPPRLRSMWPFSSLTSTSSTRSTSCQTVWSLLQHWDHGTQWSSQPHRPQGCSKVAAVRRLGGHSPEDQVPSGCCEHHGRQFDTRCARK